MPAAAIPVTLVSGFLGAGKTTLLRHLLGAPHGRRLGVIVNDFGAINVDAELIREVHGERRTVRLTNGCICCTVRGDLLEGVVQLAAQPDAPEHVVIEASGIADPNEIVSTFALPELAHIVRLDAVVVVVAAVGLQELGAAGRALAQRQLAAADLVLLNKVDLASMAERAGVLAEVRARSPWARVLETCRCVVPVEVLVGGPRDALRTHGHGEDRARWLPHVPADAFESFAFESGIPLSAERMRDHIGRFPAAVLRGKGFVHSVEAPADQGVFHLVGRRATLTRGAPWREPPCTRLVFVAERVQGTEGALREILRECLQA